MPSKSFAELRPGLRASLERKVEFRYTITAYDRRLPPVLATPAMIALMEMAAAAVLRPYLPKGAISVGTHINVSHRAAVGPGTRLEVTAVLTEVSERRYRFDVAARAGERLIGDGWVERAIVPRSVFRQRFTHRRK